MYYVRFKCFVATLVLCNLLLQGCKSGWYITPEGPLRKKPYKPSERESSDSRAVVPSTSSPTHSDVHSGRLSVGALSASLATPTSPVVAVPAVQVVPYAHNLATIPDALPPLQQAAFPEEILATTPSASPTLQAASTSLRTCVGALQQASRFPVFGAEEWTKYFGEVDVEPPLPGNIVSTLNSPCPFWPDRCVKDTHLLVLIPSTVGGAPYNLNLLKALIETPRCGGHGTQYRYYDRDVQAGLGDPSPSHSYWILMTRDVLPNSRGKSYTVQKELIAVHARETGLPYVMAGALEAATVILSYYARSGDRIYTNNPWTYTRCQDLVSITKHSGGSKHPVIVGGQSSWGLGIAYYSNGCHGGRIGVAGLQKL